MCLQGNIQEALAEREAVLLINEAAAGWLFSFRPPLQPHALFPICSTRIRFEVSKMVKTYQSSPAVLRGAPLLITESKAEFDRIREALNEEIKPRGILEQMYVEDVAYLSWEVSRLRRSKAAIANLTFRGALKDLIRQLLRKPGQSEYELGDQPEELARNWFSDPTVKKQIRDLLREFDLDESAIEAEAIRRSADDLERIDRLMASAETRRDKALVCVAQYRGDFGALLRDSSNRLIKEEAPVLEHVSGKEQKSAA
jgi:hypothetical protein